VGSRLRAPAPRESGDASAVRPEVIIEKLRAQAEKGDVHAARELRAWLAELPAAGHRTEHRAMDRAPRQRILARLIAEVEAEDAANKKNP
jgi:hypothetical protein